MVRRAWFLVFASLSIAGCGTGGGGGGGETAGGANNAAQSTVAQPTFDPPAGSFSSPPPVRIATATPSASIRYTTDGSTPTAASGTLISGNAATITVSQTQTIKAIAFQTGWTDSPVATAAYTITGASQSDDAMQSGLIAAVRQDPRLAQQVRLAPADYDALATRMSAVEGVEAAEYAGDTLGTIYVQVQGGGIIAYRHIQDDWSEIETLPPEADYTDQFHPVYNAGWTTTPVDAPKRVAAAVALSNTFATHFPVATIDPDPEYSKDESLTCPKEGSIAVVDLQYSDLKEPERDAMTSDGVMLYDRIEAMAEAANFTYRLFKDDEINALNFQMLEDYTVVILIAHGSTPSLNIAKRVNVAFPSIVTAEMYEADKPMAGNLTHEQAWQKGYILKQSLGEGRYKVMWTPRLFRDLYRPTKPQLFMVNSCWGMLKTDSQGFGRTGELWAWEEKGASASVLYNFGDGIMDAGKEAGQPTVVFGYVTPASPMAILENTMTFFRRMFGAHFSGDHPPSTFPQSYWPTCMGAQTYFRLPQSPDKKIYANKTRGGCIYTMYSDDQNQYFRNVCSQGNHHAMLQDFTLKVGAPSSAFLGCWDTWWSNGLDPTFVQDQFCDKGEPQATEEQTRLAACAVKIARKVTNAMLK